MRNRELLFWSKAAITANPGLCWEWQGCTYNGYGRTTIQINGRAQSMASRVAFFFFYGIDPGELFVCHKCDNPPCVNPNHLFLATTRENSADMVAKGRASKRKGEAHPKHKLTEPKVRLILKRLAQGETRTSIAKDFGVWSTTISAIAQGRTWTHISGG